MCHAILKIKCRVGSKHKNNTSTVFLVLDALAEAIFGFGGTSLGLDLGFSSSEEAKKSISESESAFSSASLTGLEETSSSATNGSSVADSSTF